MKKFWSTLLGVVFFTSCNNALHKYETADASTESTRDSQESRGRYDADPTERDIYLVLSANYNPYGNVIVYKENCALASITTLYGKEERDVHQSPTSYIILKRINGKWQIQKDALKAIAMEDLTEQGIENSDAAHLLSALQKATKQTN